MYRNFIQKLETWKNTSERKPLVINGVRQCGKTYILKEFGQRAFKRSHYFNFEVSTNLANIFADDLQPKKIINDLSFYLNTDINYQEDLLIFDEIQACPRALTSLKYFNETLPELALCCAGSLLGIYLNPTSFPVGKVNLANMYPLSFREFLQAINEDRLIKNLDACTAEHPISDLVHQHAWQKLKWYFIVGGLPEVVNTFINNQSNLFTAFTAVREKQNELITTYYADLAKHSGKINAMHIDRIWRNIPNQLAQMQDASAKKFKFKGVIPGIERYDRMAPAIDWLQAAGLIIKVPVIEHISFPLGANTKENNFKLYMFDIGVLGAMCNLPPKIILDYAYGTYKGYIAENFVAQELLPRAKDNIFCWSKSRAEVEFVTAWNEHILPIEVKAGSVTKSQSLKTYAEKYKPLFSSIFSANKLHIDNSTKVHRYPLYMIDRWPLI